MVLRDQGNAHMRQNTPATGRRTAAEQQRTAARAARWSTCLLLAGIAAPAAIALAASTQEAR